MSKKSNITKNQIVGGIVLAFIMCLVFFFVYKAQLADSFNKKYYATLMWEHKKNGSVELSAEKPSLSQVFTCMVPRLRIIKLECNGKKIHPNTYIEISLTEPGSGKEYYNKKVLLSSVAKKGKNKINIKMNKAIADSENRQMILTVSLLEPEDSRIKLSANYKPGIVTSFNGLPDDKTNIIYALQYSNTKHLKGLFFGLCAILLLLGLISYYLIVIRKQTVEKFFVPVALFFGIIFQCVVAVHGVPDEPWHMDTAYKLSNDLLFVEDSDIPGVIMKRQCDVVMGDMLANGVESNSYYQLLKHTFEVPGNTDLVMTSFVDSSNLVPDFIFLPTAIGLSIGRLLNLSALLTLQLGRICNLLVYILLVWFAIRQIPYGKNVMAAIALTPIALQQAASASYDPMIIGIAFLYISTALSMMESVVIKKKDIIATAILIVLLSLVKGGVYVPIVGILFLVFGRKDIRQRLKTIKKRWIVSGVVLVTTTIILLFYKITPTLKALLLKEVDVTDEDSLYSLSYILEHPMQVICLYWNTFIKGGTNHLAGMLGGKLGWHDIQMSWVLIIVILICILLFVNVDNDQYMGSGKSRICIGLFCLVSVLLILFSMLVACTTLEDTRIASVQGRYYLPFGPVLFMVTANSMVKVNEKQCEKIWMILIITNVFMVLQFVAAVL